MSITVACTLALFVIAYDAQAQPWHKVTRLSSGEEPTARPLQEELGGERESCREREEKGSGLGVVWWWGKGAGGRSGQVGVHPLNPAHPPA